MDGKGKKPRISLLVRLGFLFMAAMVISVTLVIFVIINRKLLLNSAAEQSLDAAKGITETATVFLDDDLTDYDEDYDEDHHENFHALFRKICNRTNIRYLYLYRVDENDKRHYLVMSADDDEDDEKVSKAYTMENAPSDGIPLSEIERKALSGEIDGGYEFVSNQYGDVCICLIPVSDADGNILGLIGADYDISSILEKSYTLLRHILTLIAIIFLVAILIALFFIRQVTLRPIVNLSKKMSGFIADRDMETKPRIIIFEDEVTDIENSFNKMAGDINRYVEDIKRLATDNAQNEVQFEVAKKIQNGIVPKNINVHAHGYEISGIMQPAKEVAGDFYDVFNLDDNKICIVVGDISGKGISAALFMVMVKTMIRERILSGSGISEALNLTNDELCSSNPEGMFATVFACILDGKTGELRYANAGHDMPYLIRDEGAYLEADPGILLGLFENSDITEGSITLKHGEGILIYTDGVTEAIDQAKEHFSKNRLTRAVADVRSDADKIRFAGEYTDTLMNSLNLFVKNEEQFDDITCVAAVYVGDEGVELQPVIESFEAVKRTMLTSLGDNAETKNKILACEEIFANIISYSGADSIYFYCSADADMYTVRFSDNGAYFDPTAYVSPEKDFEALDDGGMGIMLAKMNTNEMIYERIKDRNLITLHFNISICS